MQFNWGTGIAGFYLVFMIVLLSFVFKSRTYDHSLVTPNYYEADLNYQQQYDKLSNTLALSTPLSVKQTDQYLQVQFPKDLSTIQGDIWLFRPANKKEDIHLPIRVNPDNLMEIATTDFAEGYWKLKIDWKAGTEQFFNEQVITF